MQKFTEELIDKHLTKAIFGIVNTVCAADFPAIFAHFKANKPENDTTLGATFRQLEKTCQVSVDLVFTDFMNEVTDEMGMVRRTVTKNPFAEIAYQLWEGFLDRYDIKGYIENEIGEIWSEKKEELLKAGLVNEEGDAV